METPCRRLSLNAIDDLAAKRRKGGRNPQAGANQLWPVVLLFWAEIGGVCVLLPAMILSDFLAIDWISTAMERSLHGA
jgi:hypothetical protein